MKKRWSSHGMTGTREYISWRKMLQRCTSPTDRQFPLYGGRGVTVCDRWKEFTNFYADMGPRPEGMTLDRWPDNDGNYEPGNCRWATPRAQVSNRRNNILVTIDGETRCLAEWCQALQLKYQTVFTRIRRAGMSPFDAIHALPGQRGPKVI